MTNSKMFKTAHAGAKKDMIWDKANPAFGGHNYAYYFRLRLLNEQAKAKVLHTGMVPSFTIIEPERLWA